MPRTRTFATLGLAGAGLSVLLVGTLHVLAPDVSPVRRTISEYALGEYRWLFDTGVLGLCVGSALVLLALVRAGLLSWPSPGAVAPPGVGSRRCPGPSGCSRWSSSA